MKLQDELWFGTGLQPLLWYNQRCKLLKLLSLQLPCTFLCSFSLSMLSDPESEINSHYKLLPNSQHSHHCQLCRLPKTNTAVMNVIIFWSSIFTQMFCNVYVKVCGVMRDYTLKPGFSAFSIWKFLAIKCRTVIPHPPYWPHLVPCDTSFFQNSC
jgi:hypothetical protein